MTPSAHLLVLIVEDDPIVAMDEVDIVESFGHLVIGVAAEAAAAYRLADTRLPQVALMDINLADGWSGPTICARLIGDYGVPVVFVTANPDQLPINFAGALGCVEKPYGASVLGAALAFVGRYLVDGSTDEVPSGLRVPPRPALIQ